MTGRVSFVGAGPGAADLITLRGARRIAEADIVVWAASLIDPQCIRDHAGPEAEVVDSSRITHEDVLEIYRRAARDGLKVARVHSGDPSLWGAVQEQYDAAKGLGLDVEIVPGVSAFSAAAAVAGRELTVPEVAQSVILTRLEGGKTPMPEGEQIREFARHGTTMAVFLSAARSGQLVEELRAGGYPDDTPVLVAYKVTWPEELVLSTTIGELTDTVKQHKLWRHTLFLIGRSLSASGTRSHLYDPGHFTTYRKSDPASRRALRSRRSGGTASGSTSAGSASAGSTSAGSAPESGAESAGESDGSARPAGWSSLHTSRSGWVAARVNSWSGSRTRRTPQPAAPEPAPEPLPAPAPPVPAQPATDETPEIAREKAVTTPVDKPAEQPVQGTAAAAWTAVQELQETARAGRRQTRSAKPAKAVAPDQPTLDLDEQQQTTPETQPEPEAVVEAAPKPEPEPAPEATVEPAVEQPAEPEPAPAPEPAPKPVRAKTAQPKTGRASTAKNTRTARGKSGTAKGSRKTAAGRKSTGGPRPNDDPHER
ncbi:MAG TPA: precorrin-4 C(11)-methyltransferase [Pseudonocardiaceae bacterium]